LGKIIRGTGTILQPDSSGEGQPYVRIDRSKEMLTPSTRVQLLFGGAAIASLLVVPAAGTHAPQCGASVDGHMDICVRS